MATAFNQSITLVATGHAVHLRALRDTPAGMVPQATLGDQINQAFYDWAEGLWSDPAQRTADNARAINAVKDNLNTLGYAITR